MTAATIDPDLRDDARAVTGLWWLVLLAGIAWLLVAMLVLRFDTASVTTVGILLGFVFLAGAATEMMEAVVVRSWRWTHILLALLFVAASVWAFVSPSDVFWSLASILGLLLVLKGTFTILLATESRPVNPTWGLGLAAGILEILLGFWASQQFYPARAALLLLWIGFACLFRGIAEIAVAIQLRHTHKELAAG